MDIYAQPHSVASVVWMQQAPHDPRRRKLGAFGIHTAYSGERDAEPSGVTTRGFHPSSARTGLPSHRSETTASRISGDQLSDSEALQPVLYATGDEGDKYHSATKPLSGGVALTDEVARISDQRIRLLAARYGQSNTSAEILARLTILDTRLTEKAPRVSKEQLDVLEQNLDLLANLRKNREVLASKFAALANR